MDPGGVMMVLRLGAFLSSMTAKPPSTFIWVWAKAAVVPATAAPTRKARRSVSTGFGAATGFLAV